MLTIQLLSSSTESPCLIFLSGAKLNKGKTKAMWLGQWSNCIDEPLGLHGLRK